MTLRSASLQVPGNVAATSVFDCALTIRGMPMAANVAPPAKRVLRLM
jgi:hypothetical protein